MLSNSVLCSGLHIASTSFTCGSCLRRDHIFFFFFYREEEVSKLTAVETSLSTCRHFKTLKQFSEQLRVWRYDGIESLNLKKKTHSCSTSDYTDAIVKAEHRVMKKIMLNSIKTPETWLGNQVRDTSHTHSNNDAMQKACANCSDANQIICVESDKNVNFDWIPATLAIP